MTPLPVVLSIAGSDCSAGAGIQADLKTCSALDTYALTTVTCVVAESPHKVASIHPIPPSIVAEQILLNFEAFPINAVKTGMLFSNDIILAISSALESLPTPLPPLVLDPVMLSSSGSPLLSPDALDAFCHRLVPLASLVTPNLDEASVLCNQPITSLADMESAGKSLSTKFNTSFLIKGGHLRFHHATTASDLLITPDGYTEWFETPFVTNTPTHGTGCTLSAAIAAGLAKSLPLPEAIRQAKQFIASSIAASLCWHTSTTKTFALQHFRHS